MFNSIRKIIGSTALTLGLMSLAAVRAANVVRLSTISERLREFRHVRGAA